MDKSELYDNISFLFNRHWDEELTDEEEEMLQDKYDILVNNQGWESVFCAIDHYMRSECLTGDAACNFAHLFWGYTCANPRKIPEPYSFLGYLYYRVNSKPWDYDCAEVYEGLVFNMLSGEDDYNHNPFTNYDYIPEKDPEIMAEVEKLRKENA